MKLWIARTYVKLNNCILTLVGNILFQKPSSNLDTVVIYMASNLGDTICRIPAMYMIRKRYPKAHLVLFTTPMDGGVSAREILGHVSWIDEIIVYHKEDVKDLKSAREFFQRYKYLNVDYLINFPYAHYPLHVGLKELLWMKFLGVKALTGFRCSRSSIYQLEQARSIPVMNETERCVKELPFDTSAMPREYHLEISQSDLKKMKCMIKSETGQDDLTNILLISFAGKGKAKYWLPERFHEIAVRWIKKGGTVLVIGGSGEKADAEEITSGITGCYNFCGRTTLLESFALIKLVGKVLTIDTGTAHQASAVGAKCVTLMCARDYPNAWHPAGENVVVIRKDLACSPCFSSDRGCKYGIPSRCMEAITVDEVWDVIENSMLEKEK